MRLAVLPLLFLFAVAAVAHPVGRANRPALNQSFDLRVGETSSALDEGIKITFKSVVEDSRCPEDVTCVWAGNAKVVLTIIRGAVSRGRRIVKTITLNSGLNPKHIAFQGYDIKLAGVKPPRNTHKQIKQSDYVITLTVTKI